MTYRMYFHTNILYVGHISVAIKWNDTHCSDRNVNKSDDDDNNNNNNNNKKKTKKERLNSVKNPKIQYRVHKGSQNCFNAITSLIYI